MTTRARSLKACRLPVLVGGLLLVSFCATAGLIFEADFNGPGGGAGGTNDLVALGGTGGLISDAHVTGSVVTGNSLGGGNYLNVAIAANRATGTYDVPAIFTFAGAANSFAAWQGANLMGQDGNQYTSLNGAFDMFFRPGNTWDQQPFFHPIYQSWGFYGAGKLRLDVYSQWNGFVLYLRTLNGDSTPVFTNIVKGVGTVIQTNSTTVGLYTGDHPGFTTAAGGIYHLGLTLSTATNGVITFKAFFVQGTNAINTAGTPQCSVTFRLLASLVGSSAFTSGPWGFGEIIGAPAANAYNYDVDCVRLYNADPGTFRALGSPLAYAPVISQQPASPNLYVGLTGQLTVGASGSPAPSYQWLVETNGTYLNLSDGGGISGSATAALTINNVAAANATNYVVILTNTQGSVTSSVATLTLQTPVAPTATNTIPALSIQNTNSSLQLNWSGGILLAATNLLGPWFANTNTSPLMVIPSQPQMFYQVEVPANVGDDFIGPLAGWDSIKNYGATGNGTTDDTAAIQNALNAWGTSGHSSVLFIPAGTYKITSTLYATNQSGCELLGDSPATTKFVWQGPAGGTMFDFNDQSSTRIGRFTLDGQKTAGVGVWLWEEFGHSFQSEVEDTVFQNMAIGLQFCGHAGEVGQSFIADCPVERCQFLNCTNIGMASGGYNTLDLPVWYCLFDHCGTGVGTGFIDGGGNLQVYYSVFRYSSVADAAISADAYNSLRGNYSIGANQFAISGWSSHNTCNLTLQDNVVLDCTNTPVSIQNNGPVMLIDNIIRYSRTPVVYEGTDTYADLVSVGNQYCVASPFNSYPRTRQLDDQTVSAGSITNTQPALPPTPPNNKTSRWIYELSANATGADIQNAINSAYASHNGQKAVIHISQGTHLVSTTITIPANSDVQLIGDGMNNSLNNRASLQWSAAYYTNSTLLSIAAPSRATIRDLCINGPYENSDTTQWPVRGVVAAIADQPGDRVHLDQVAIFSRAYTANQWSHLLLYGISNSLVEANGLYLDIGGPSMGDGVEVYGGGSAGSSWGGGRVFLMPVNSGAFSNTVYKIYGNPHLVVEDSWFESHPDFQPRFMSFTDSGTFTMQGCLDSPATDTWTGPYTNLDVTPGIDVGNFSGNISFLNVVHGHNPPYNPSYPTTTGPHPTFTTIEFTATSSCNFLMLANVGDDTGNGWTNGVWFNNHSTSVNYGFLNNQYTINAGGSLDNVHSGNTNAIFLRTMLNQARTEKSSPWPLAPTLAGTTDLRFSRVTIMNASSLPFTVYGTNSGFH